MSSSAAKTSGENRESVEESRSSLDLSMRMDYYGGDFVEDGSFLVLNTDVMSLSPTTPPLNNSDDEEDKKLDIEVINENDEDVTPSSSINRASSLSQPQVLGEDPESSVESSHSTSSQRGKETNSLTNSCQNDAVLNSITNMSVASGSSASTDTHLNESTEEINLLMADNKKLTELLADSNEKMKQCIATTEKLKMDHEEYKKKSEESREVINQLRHDNELLKSQVSLMQSQPTVEDKTQQNSEKDQETLKQQSRTISELNEQLSTVLTYNGKLNDEIVAIRNKNEELKTELRRIQAEKDDAVNKMDVMRNELDTARIWIAKYKEHQVKTETELANAVSNVRTLESVVEEKTKLTDSLKRNMEDTVAALERVNLKLNQKDQEISLINTKLAALTAEQQFPGNGFQNMAEEHAKLAAEKQALLVELNARNQQLKEVTDALAVYRARDAEFASRGDAARNDNSADNANESLPSPRTSLPSVAGQLVGFVRRELLGWEEQAGAAGDATTRTPEGATASAETVVQQPKQEAIPPCPICRRTFASLERLQTHASNCGIENDDGQPDDPFVFP